MEEEKKRKEKKKGIVYFKHRERFVKECSKITDVSFLGFYDFGFKADQKSLDRVFGIGNMFDNWDIEDGNAPLSRKEIIALEKKMSEVCKYSFEVEKELKEGKITEDEYYKYCDWRTAHRATGRETLFFALIETILPDSCYKTSVRMKRNAGDYQKKWSGRTSNGSLMRCGLKKGCRMGNPVINGNGKR